MVDDFTPTGGNSKAAQTSWTSSSEESTAFVPFPYSGQPGTPEVGYGDEGYGDDGYDSPPIPASLAPTVTWSSGVTK